MKRGFEKISLNQFIKDTGLTNREYDEIKIPKRKTSNSAGYDISLLEDISIKPGTTKMIKTGLKIKMNESEVLFIVIRSSVGFKYNVGLPNQMGVIDADYYNNEENEGHLYIPLHNYSNELFELKKNQSFAQGIFVNYLVADNDEETNEKRKGGFGSTDGKK